MNLKSMFNNRKLVRTQRAIADCHGNCACIICSHVASDYENVGFVSSAQNKWGAFCCKDCPELETGDGLSMLCTRHVIEGCLSAAKVFSMPTGFDAIKEAGVWRYYYDRDDVETEYEPEEGDFIALSADHIMLSMKDEDPLKVFQLKDEKLVTVNFDSTLRVLPVWSGKPCKKFEEKLYGYEEIVSCSLGSDKSLLPRGRHRFYCV